MGEIMLGLPDQKVIGLTQKNTDFTKKLKDEDLDIRIFPFSVQNGIKKTMGALRFSKFVYQLCKKEKVDVLHINDMNTLLHLAPVLRLLPVKVIFNIRDVFEPNRKYGKKWRLVNHCDEILVLSEHMKQELLQRLPLNNSKNWKKHFHTTFSIVNLNKYKPVEAEKRRDLKKALGFEEDFSHWLYVATFGIKKNQLGFLNEAMPLLEDKAVKIHFVGDFDPENDSYAAEFDQVLKQSSLKIKERVVLHGYQSEVDQFYKAADLTLVPTLREGLARCMIESLSSGLAVISFDVSSAREIIEENELGAVVQQGEYKALIHEALSVKNRSDLSSLAAKTRNFAINKFNKQAVIKSYKRAIGIKDHD